jgi:hypothetical protein
MFDLPVDFDALLTHGTRLDVTQTVSIGHLLSYDGGWAILFKQLRIIGAYFAGFSAAFSCVERGFPSCCFHCFKRECGRWRQVQ